MTTLLPFPARCDQLWSSLGLHLRTTTAIWRDELAKLSPFGAPEIGWRRSPAGMELVWPGVSEDSDWILVTVSGHYWQPLRDPQRAITTILEEAEFEYEALRPIEPRALAVQPEDAALDMPPGEQDGPRRSRRYSAADIDQLRMALRLASQPLPGTASLGQPLVPAALARARAIVAAWDAYQAADILARTRSGYALWRRIAVAMGYGPMALEITAALPACLQGCSGSIQNLVPSGARKPGRPQTGHSRFGS